MRLGHINVLPWTALWATASLNSTWTKPPAHGMCNARRPVPAAPDACDAGQSPCSWYPIQEAGTGMEAHTASHQRTRQISLNDDVGLNLMQKASEPPGISTRRIAAPSSRSLARSRLRTLPRGILTKVFAGLDERSPVKSRIIGDGLCRIVPRSGRICIAFHLLHNLQGREF